MLKLKKEDAVWDALTKVYEYCDQEQFIFVLDEWDYIYHQSYMTTEDKAAYTKFLSNLLKDKAYVELALYHRNPSDSKIFQWF